MLLQEVPLYTLAKIVNTRMAVYFIMVSKLKIFVFSILSENDQDKMLFVSVWTHQMTSRYEVMHVIDKSLCMVK